VTTDPHEILGTWTLHRRVVDRLAGTHGTVTGVLHVTTEAEGVRWTENGELTWNGGTYPVTRTNRIHLLDGDWWVLFEDGRPFHPWRPGEKVLHPCAADIYEGLIAIDRDGARMRTLWDVRGPAKWQRLFTRLILTTS
jgi:hypothetical protein